MNVILTYFKPSGKYYSDGETSVPPGLPLHEIHDHVRDLMDQQKLPGLIDGHSDFIVSVDVPEHLNNYPHILVP